MVGEMDLITLVIMVEANLNLLIIQPSSKCNLNCTYCYIPERDRRNSQKIDIKTVDLLLEKVLNSNIVKEKLQILFHSGEPLTVPMHMYDEIFKLIDKHNQKNIRIIKTVQTNGTLFTEKWIDFFKKNKMTASLSLDGPAFLHDASRRGWDGSSTHEKVMEKVKLLKDHNIPVSPLAVVTKTHLDFPEEFFFFFLNNKLYNFAFNVEEMELNNEQSSLKGSESVYIKYKAFIKTLQKLNKKHPQVNIREFQQTRSNIHSFLENKNFVASQDVANPLNILTCTTNGDLYTFCPEMAGQQEMSVGNIYKIKEIKDLLKNKNFIKLKNQINKGISECKNKCDYFSFCGGGRPANKFYETGSFASTETVACNLQIKKLIDCYLESFDEPLDNMPLLSGTKVFLESKALIEKNTGAYYLKDNQNFLHYSVNSVLPNTDWVECCEKDKDILLLKNKDDFKQQKDILIFDVSPSMKEGILSFEFNKANNADDILAIQKTRQWNLFLENELIPFFLKFTQDNKDIALSEIAFSQPGLETVSFDKYKKRFVGLHIDDRDAFGRNGVSYCERDKTRPRISINLGPDPRYFLFCNLNVDDCVKYNMINENELIEIKRCLGFFPKKFFEKFPNYSVKRIKLDVGQGYLAPTDNIIHDGSSSGTDKFDLSIVSLGDFFPIKENSSIPKFAFA